MRKVLRSAARSALMQAKQVMKSNGLVRSLLYEEENEDQFTDLRLHEHFRVLQRLEAGESQNIGAHIDD